MGGFNIEGSLYGDDISEKQKRTLRQKLGSIFCWVIYQHDYLAQDTMYIQGRRYYFRVCQRCHQEDEGFG